nr:hypothetical protein [Tanacetum cinerariifolium]
LPPRRNNHVNNEANLAFTAAVAHTVADLLPTFTARITDEIRQNENNGNNAHIEKIFEVLGCGDQFKVRLATYKLEGDAHSWWRAYKQAKGSDAYVATLSWNDFCDICFLQYFPYSEKEKCEREYKLIRQLPEETSTDFMKRFLRLAGQRMKETTRGTETTIVYDHQTHHYKGLIIELMIERIVTDMARWQIWQKRQACHRATGACFECGDVRHLAKDCKKCNTDSRGNKNNKPHATSGRVFALTTEQAANAPGRF